MVSLPGICLLSKRVVIVSVFFHNPLLFHFLKHIHPGIVVTVPTSVLYEMMKGVF
jgi:hypothetical protein